MCICLSAVRLYFDIRYVLQYDSIPCESYISTSFYFYHFT